MGTRRVSSPHGEFTLFFTYKSPFSNFFKCNFKAKALDETSIDCICVEQFYMYNKAVSCGDHAVAKKVLQSDDPKEIKRLGAQLLGFDRTKWNKISEDVMKTALKAKFSRNEDLRELLFATHGSELVECSPMDRIWGIGLAIDDPEVLNPKLWKGENKLGKLMTKVREKLWSKRKFRNDRRKAEKLDTPEDAIKYFNIHCRYSPEPRLARSARPAYTSMSGAWNTSSVDRPTPSRRRRHSQSPTPPFDSKYPRILFRSEMSKKYRKESSPERRKDASPPKSVSSSITKMGFSRSSCRRSQSPLRGSHAEKDSRDSPGQSSATCSYSRRDFAPEESHYKKTEPGVKEKAAKAEKKEGTPTKTPEKSVDSHRSGRRRSPSPVKGSYAKKTFDSSSRLSFETGPRSRRDSAPEAAYCKKAGEMEVKDEKASETNKKNDATVTEKSLDSHMSNRHRSTTPPSKCPINKSSRHSSSQNITTTTEKKEEKPKRESIKWPEDKLPRSFRFREVSNSDEDSRFGRKGTKSLSPSSRRRRRSPSRSPVRRRRLNRSSIRKKRRY